MLEQAIIDASQLRAVALKNAQEALLEKYAPQVREAVSKILEADEEEVDDIFGGSGQPEVGEGENSGAKDIPLAAMEGEDMCPCPNGEEEIEIDFAELEKALRDDEQEVGIMSADDDEEALEEEVSKLLESEIEEAINEELAEEEGESDEDKSDEEKKDEEIEEGYMSPKRDDEAVIMKEGETIEFIKKTILSETQKISENVLNENKKLLSTNKQLLKENKDLKDSLTGFKTKLLEVSKKVKKLNLDKAKLYYTNKVLKNASLNERQKVKVVDALNRAGTVEEAKIVYETLEHSTSVKVDDKPETLSEVAGRNRTKLLSRTQQNTNSPQAARWKALAGIDR